jgi:hypothetical protein
LDDSVPLVAQRSTNGSPFTATCHERPPPAHLSTLHTRRDDCLVQQICSSFSSAPVPARCASRALLAPMQQAIDANTLLAERQIIATLQALLAAVDQKNWHFAETLFSPKVHLCVGGPRVDVAPSALVAQWRSVLARCETTLHFLSNHAVILQDNTAACSSNVVGLHVATEADGSQSHLITFGTFEHQLRQQGELWKIEALTFKQQFSLGNQALLVH